MGAKVIRQHDFISISTDELGEASLNATFTEATKIRDELMRLFPPTLKEVNRIYKEDE